MAFEWDADKAASDLAKHAASPAGAMTIFAYPLEIMIADPDHSDAEFDRSLAPRRASYSNRAMTATGPPARGPWWGDHPAET